jgi:hypothetical protein
MEKSQIEVSLAEAATIVTPMTVDQIEVVIIKQIACK